MKSAEMREELSKGRNTGREAMNVDMEPPAVVVRISIQTENGQAVKDKIEKSFVKEQGSGVDRFGALLKLNLQNVAHKYHMPIRMWKELPRIVTLTHSNFDPHHYGWGDTQFPSDPDVRLHADNVKFSLSVPPAPGQYNEQSGEHRFDSQCVDLVLYLEKTTIEELDENHQEWPHKVNHLSGFRSYRPLWKSGNDTYQLIDQSGTEQSGNFTQTQVTGSRAARQAIKQTVETITGVYKGVVVEQVVTFDIYRDEYDAWIQELPKLKERYLEQNHITRQGRNGDSRPNTGLDSDNANIYPASVNRSNDGDGVITLTLGNPMDGAVSVANAGLGVIMGGGFVFCGQRRDPQPNTSLPEFGQETKHRTTHKAEQKMILTSTASRHVVEESDGEEDKTMAAKAKISKLQSEILDHEVSAAEKERIEGEITQLAKANELEWPWGQAKAGQSWV